MYVQHFSGLLGCSARSESLCKGHFGDKYSVFLPASQKDPVKVLTGKKEQINNYLKSNAVSFTKIEDILGILTSIEVL